MWHLLREMRPSGTVVVLFLLLVVSGLAHGYNMFHFPYYENDEGLYMSYAWSLLKHGELAPYTYWYDHAPGGWMLLALWVKLTGGFFTFGASINSGRVLMLLLHLGSSALLFFLARKISGRTLGGIVAVLLFSLSPLAIYFQRRVLLDNIMTFWMLCALALLYRNALTLSRITLSALLFGLAVLTKENALVLTPAFLYALWTHPRAPVKRFSVPLWVFCAFAFISLYPLLATLKGELLPPREGGTPHVSLLSTLAFHAQRGTGLSFWQAGSDFQGNVSDWMRRDWLLIVSGGLGVLIGAVVAIREKALRVPMLLSGLIVAFLLRGGLVINFYIIPLIPLSALIIGTLVSYVVAVFHRGGQALAAIVSALAIGTVVLSSVATSTEHWVQDETTPTLRAIEWIKRHVPENAVLAVDGVFQIDLWEQRTKNDRVFPRAELAWKVEKDPEVFQRLGSDWTAIEYITASHEILKQIRSGEFPHLRKALTHAAPVAEWKDGTTSYIDLPNFVSTNGDWMSIYRLPTKSEITLDASWRFYASRFIHEYGQVIDPSDGRTTSEGQAYAMLRAVWQGDRERFDGVWAWTKDHLQFREKDRLFSWLWKDDAVQDSATATDADEDIALALLFAHKRWGNPEYFSVAQSIIHDIWRREVVQIHERYYLVSGSDAERKEGYLVNPSYLAPATYRIFADVDPEHPWRQLAEDSYALLNALGVSEGNTTFLPPNWVLVDKETGALRSAAQYMPDSNADDYGYDAFRVFWRIALDALWFQEPRALEYLERVKPFFTETWEHQQEVAAIYALDGKSLVPHSSLSTSVGPLAIFAVTDPELAATFYRKVFELVHRLEEGYWGDAANYYDQNWVWLGFALHTRQLPNLWSN